MILKGILRLFETSSSFVHHLSCFAVGLEPVGCAQHCSVWVAFIVTPAASERSGAVHMSLAMWRGCPLRDRFQASRGIFPHWGVRGLALGLLVMSLSRRFQREGIPPTCMCSCSPKGCTVVRLPAVTFPHFGPDDRPGAPELRPPHGSDLNDNRCHQHRMTPHVSFALSNRCRRYRFSSCPIFVRLEVRGQLSAPRAAFRQLLDNFWAQLQISPALPKVTCQDVWRATRRHFRG